MRAGGCSSNARSRRSRAFPARSTSRSSTRSRRRAPTRRAASRSTAIPPADPKNLPTVDNRVVTVDYFNAMGIPLVRGRGFTSADRHDAAPVAIVSESMAAKYWPGEDPIGRRLKGPRRAVDHGGRHQRRRHPGLVRSPERPDHVSPVRAGADRVLRGGRPHRRRPGDRRRRRPAGAAARGSAAAGLRDDDDARAAVGSHDRPALHRGDHVVVRGARAAAGGGRPLRRDRLPRRAAPARDRPAHRAGRVARAT